MPKSLGAKHLGAETYRAEPFWCRTSRAETSSMGRNVLVPSLRMVEHVMTDLNFQLGKIIWNVQISINILG